MNRATRAALMLLVPVAAAVTRPAPAQSADAAGDAAAVRTLCETFAAERRLPALSAVVMRHDTVIATCAVDAATAVNTPAPVYQLGSIGKQFLSALIVTLAEEGHLSLDAPVVKLLPQFNHLPPTMQVRHLLAHTSGSREIFTIEAYGAGIRDLTRGSDELVAIMRGAPVDFAAGARWTYSNTGYLMLALIAERVTGLPYEEAMRARLFAPLGLASLHQCPSVQRAPHEMRGHTRRRGKDGIEVIEAPPENMNWIRGDGGLCGNAPDLARWVRALAAGRAVSPAAYARMTAPTVLNDGRRADYGFALATIEPDGVAKLAHTGSMLGFSTAAAYYPAQQVTVVVLASLGDISMEVLERRIARRLLRLPAPDYRAVPLDAAQRAAFISSFDIGVFDARFVEREGALWIMTPPPGPRTPLRYLGGGLFVSDRDPDEYRVEFLDPAVPDAQAPQRIRLMMGAMHWYGERRP